MPKFYSKQQAMATRRIIWVCKICDAPHDKKLLGLKGKPEKCMVCLDYREFFKLDSHAEFTRFGELRLAERVAMITNLQTQVPFDLETKNGIFIAKYYADFVYKRNGNLVIEDVKSSPRCVTDLSKHKIKHLELQLGIKVDIIYRS